MSFENDPNLNKLLIFERAAFEERTAKVVSAFFVLICIFGLLANLVVIFIIFFLKEYKKSVTHWYILQLAFADTVFLLTIPLNASERLRDGWMFSDGLCKLKEGVLFINYYASIMFLMVMSIDRYIAVCHIFSPRLQKLRKSTASSIVTIVVWLAALLLAIPIFIFSTSRGLSPYCKCSHVFPKERTQEELMECYNQFPPGLPREDLENLCNPKELCLKSNFLDEYDFSFEFPDESINFNMFDNLDSSGNITGEELDPLTNNNTFGVFGFFNNSVDSNFYQSLEASGDYDSEDIIIEDSCSNQDHPPGWFAFVWFHFTVMFLLPVTVMSACYGLIIHRFLNRTIQDAGTGSQNPPSGFTKERRKVTQLCIILVATFIACWILLHAVQLAKLAYLPFSHEGCVIISDISVLLAYLNSALNPFLYSFLGSGCRRKWKMVSASSSVMQVFSVNKTKTTGGSSVGRRTRMMQTKRSGVQEVAATISQREKSTGDFL